MNPYPDAALASQFVKRLPAGRPDVLNACPVCGCCPARTRRSIPVCNTIRLTSWEITSCNSRAIRARSPASAGGRPADPDQSVAGRCRSSRENVGWDRGGRRSPVPPRPRRSGEPRNRCGPGRARGHGSRSTFDSVHLREVLSNFTKETQRLVVAQRSAPEVPIVPPAEGVQILRQPNHKLKPAEVAALVAAYEAGVSIAALAIQFELHYETARAHLLRNGVALRGNAKPATPAQRRTILRLHEEGVTKEEIGRRIGMSPRTVGRVLRAGQ